MAAQTTAQTAADRRDLIAYGFSAPKALEIALDAKRGDASAIAVLNAARTAVAA